MELTDKVPLVWECLIHRARRETVVNFQYGTIFLSFVDDRIRASAEHVLLSDPYLPPVTIEPYDREFII